MFPLKSINTSTYSNKQHQMSHSFHTPIQVLLVVTEYSRTVFWGFFSCLWTVTDSIQSAAGRSEFYLPSDWLLEWCFAGVGVLDDRKLHRPPCVVGSPSQELNRPHQFAGGPGLTHIMVRLMRSDSERCSWLSDKTKAQMCLTPSPDYFYLWHRYNQIPRPSYPHS